MLYLAAHERSLGVRLLWIHGFKSKAASADPPPWHEYLVAQLLDRVDDYTAADGTSDAESALGFEASVYWFVSSPSSAYTGGALTIWEPTDLDHAPGGLCPFDTGGMVLGHIVTRHPEVAASD